MSVSPEGIPTPLRDFLHGQIRSIEQLEILLLLHSEPSKTWTVAEIFHNIQSSPASVQSRLTELKNAGLVECVDADCFRYSPSTSQTRDIVDLLAENYRNRRVRVIEALYKRRADAIQLFAEAFQFKRKE